MSILTTERVVYYWNIGVVLRRVTDCIRSPRRDQNKMRRCGKAVTVQSTVVVILLLIGTLLVLDSYKWRRLPWYSNFSKVTAIEGQKHQGGNGTLPAIQGDGHSESFQESSPDQGEMLLFARLALHPIGQLFFQFSLTILPSVAGRASWHLRWGDDENLEI